MADPYVTLDDVRAYVPYVDQLDPGVDGFLVQRKTARDWFDAAVMTAAGVRTPIEIVVADDVKRANALKAAAEILMIQITPTVDANAFQSQADRYAEAAESAISTMVVRTAVDNYALRLGVSRRG